MNKYTLLWGVMLFNIILTFTAYAMTGFGVNGDLLTGAPNIGTFGLIDFFIVIIRVVPFFFQLVTFQVTGIPAIITATVFIPINIVMLLLIVSLIRGTD